MAEPFVTDDLAFEHIEAFASSILFDDDYSVFRIGHEWFVRLSDGSFVEEDGKAKKFSFLNSAIGWVIQDGGAEGSREVTADA